ncbi:MAG: DUF883 family protein [Limisphaerales bacterium]
MDKQTQATSNDMGTLPEDARALMAATADVAGEKVAEARKRLAAALERGKEICGRVRFRLAGCIGRRVGIILVGRGNPANQKGTSCEVPSVFQCSGRFSP